MASPGARPRAAFTYCHRVRFRDCDPQGRVFNANYLSFVDDAVSELWRLRFGGWDRLVAEGSDFVVAEATIRFTLGAGPEDLLDIELTPAVMGTTSMTFAFHVAREEEPVASGQVRYVFIDPRSGGKAPIPPRIRAAVGALHDPGHGD